MNKQNFTEVLDYAIQQEQAAADFYLGLAQKVQEDHVRQTLLEFAKQEQGHKARLEAIREGVDVPTVQKNVPDLKLSDYLVEVEPTSELSFQGALIVAMKKEKAAYRMYQDLAARCQDNSVRDVFRFLALEEANHKLNIEVQYDELIYQEN